MSNKDSLLARAKSCLGSARTNLTVTDEEIELTKAWLKGEVNFRQVSHALKSKTCTGFLLSRLKLMYAQGELK